MTGSATLKRTIGASWRNAEKEKLFYSLGACTVLLGGSRENYPESLLPKGDRSEPPATLRSITSIKSTSSAALLSHTARRTAATAQTHSSFHKPSTYVTPSSLACRTIRARAITTSRARDTHHPSSTVTDTLLHSSILRRATRKIFFNHDVSVESSELTRDRPPAQPQYNGGYGGPPAPQYGGYQQGPPPPQGYGYGAPGAPPPAQQPYGQHPPPQQGRDITLDPSRSLLTQTKAMADPRHHPRALRILDMAPPTAIPFNTQTARAGAKLSSLA
nr:hypothetical protein CFP56_72142 [Quercus suber]